MMRFKTLLLGLTLVLSAFSAAQSSKDKAPAADAKTADSGSFSILVRGKRVATETFRIEQRGPENVITSELKFDDGATKATQTAEMQIGSNGNLKRYAWKETSPSKMEVVVEPQDADFLVAHVTDDKGTKDNVHPLSAFTSIVDANFFSQLELLMWKFVAMGCQTTPNGLSQCDFKDKKLPILYPRDQQSGMIGIEYAGKQKFRWKNKDTDCTTFKIVGEGVNYTVFLDNQSRLVRVLIPDDGTEVVRD